ncbi:hypothetical protein BCR36DRAFT_46017 [Piromyces finnis]|uniref:Uncharacterized protein n=1 Tax=Piromyces finnis TaxID=1754191 RepID=A0A1Y1VBK8_9FUNG|nr:hypothetical protein BCR36DRAFT_46017 [Piromyces finnis]|eukprot:ORX51144.1 hypothetical protein BCR36DRAFT_46017 [Piromyces finnis]
MNFQKSSEEINIYDFFEEWTKIHSDMERNQKEVVKKLETLEEIKQNQDKMIKSYTMIIKIRDSMIEQLRKKVESGKSLLIEKKLNKDESMDLPEYLFQWDNENKLLLDEIQELKFLHNQDPERKKLEKENFILQNQIDQLKKCKLEYENYLQLKTYYQRYIGLLTNQWFDSQKENQYLKQQLQQLSYTPNNTLKSMKPPLYPIDKENNYPFQHSNQQHTFKSLSLSSSKTSYTNEININHNTNFLININPTFNTQEQNIKNFEEKLLESEQFVKEFNQNLKSKAINYLSNSATLIKNNKKIEKDNNDKISLTNSPFSINQKQRRETLAINDLFSENENVEDLINMDDIYGIKEGSLSQKHDLDFDSFDGISFKKQRFSIETELSDSISPPNNTSLLVKHSSILHPSSTNNMNLDNTQETKLNSFLDQNEKVISLIEEEQKKILNSDIDNLHNDDINNGNLIKNENRVEKEVLSDNDNKTKNKIKQEEMNIKNDVIIYTEPLNDNSVVDKEEIEKVLTEQFVKIEEELKRKNSTLQSKVEQLENDLSKVNEKHKAILKEKELESLKLLDQYDNKSKELLSIIEENKTLKQDLQFAEDNKKQVEEQQLIISNLNSKILILEKAYEIEKSEKKGLSDKLQKQQDEQTKNNNLQLELQDKYNLTKNENIGLQLKIDQTESLNEDMKNEIDHMKLYLKSYKDKCEKFEEYEIKMKKEIENVLNKNITGMGFDEQLKELFNMYYQYKNDIHSKEEVSKKDKEQIKELYEQIDKLKQDHNQFKQKVEKEKSKYKSEISSQIENIDKLKQEIKGKNIKLFEMNKEKEKQVLLCQALEKKIKDYEFKLEISNLRYEEVYKKMILEKSEKIQLMEKHNTYTMDEKKKDIIINNLTLDVEKLNNKLKGKLKNEDQIQQENQKLTEQLHELQQQINKHNKNYQDLKIQLEDKTQESLHYVRKVREYEKERFEISKKLNALEELKAIHEKDIEELSQKTKQLNDTQKLAEEATLIASYKENEKNTILESYEENKKVQEEIIKEYEKKFTQKEKESSREVKALRNEIHSLKEANTNDKNKLTKDYENKIKRLNYEINSLEKENEALKNENLNLVMPKNQNQRIKYLRKIKNESDHWKEIALRFRRELDKRGIYIKL